MSVAKSLERKQRVAASDAYARNAQHGQNRAGIDLADAEEFDDWESARPIDPREADARVADEGAEIRARIRARGHDVLERR